MRYLSLSLLSTICFLSLFSPLAAEYTLRGGKIINTDELPTMPVDQHFNAGITALEEGDGEEAATQFRIVIHGFPNTSYANEAHFYLGLAHVCNEDFDFANEEFSDYLKTPANQAHFQDALDNKFAIAEKFADGEKRHVMGSSYLPKWLSARQLAIDIYSEIIAAIPCHELAVQSLFSKGILQWEMEDYRQSIETFQLLTKRFPTHELAPEAFLSISRIYYEQSLSEFQNPDILSLSQINCRKFATAFPRDERVEKAEKFVMRIKEVYAWGLYDTGQFYERRKYPKASIIYYRNALTQFPDTSVAKLCQERLCVLEKKHATGK